MMAQLNLGEVILPFAYEVIPVATSLADDFKRKIDYKVCGIDSLVDTLQDSERVAYALKWPMIVLSIPGIPEDQITGALNNLPKTKNMRINYEYDNSDDSKLLNYNFELGKTVDNPIVHSSYIRSGKNSAFLASSVKEYIKSHNLYVAHFS